jgi:ribonuclease HII
MAILVGIDEAGFGPILGPLVVSSTVFSLPVDLLKADLWHILRKSITQKRQKQSGRLLITDSKKAHNKSSGIKHLERTTLSLIRVLDKHPASVTALIKFICPDCLDRLKTYPWYQGLDQHELLINDPDKTIAAKVFIKDTAQAGISLLDMHSKCLDVAHYNSLNQVVRNKSNVLFTETCSLLQRAFDLYEQDDFQVVIDRQGGRTHYRDSLQRMFPDYDMTILLENENLSSYQMRAGDRKLRVHFVVRADGKCMPVSLASMLSKYVRELLIMNLNAFFIDMCKEIKPTAGYWQDGTRFINEVKARLPKLKINEHQFIRCR